VVRRMAAHDRLFAETPGHLESYRTHFPQQLAPISEAPRSREASPPPLTGGAGRGAGPHGPTR
jgi:hypothetical protein